MIRPFEYEVVVLSDKHIIENVMNDFGGLIKVNSNSYLPTITRFGIM